MRSLDKQKFYAQLHTILTGKYGDVGERIWQQAADEYDEIISDSYFRKHKEKLPSLRSHCTGHSEQTERMLTG